jgi:hypothetical protein
VLSGNNYPYCCRNDNNQAVISLAAAVRLPSWRSGWQSCKSLGKFTCISSTRCKAAALSCRAWSSSRVSSSIQACWRSMVSQGGMTVPVFDPCQQGQQTCIHGSLGRKCCPQYKQRTGFVFAFIGLFYRLLPLPQIVGQCTSVTF